MLPLMPKEIYLIEQFRNLSLACELVPNSVKLGMLRLTNNVLEEIKEGQKPNSHLIDQLVLINQGKLEDFKVGEYKFIRFQDKVCLPDVPELKRRILEEGHMSGMNFHPSVPKIY